MGRVPDVPIPDLDLLDIQGIWAFVGIKKRTLTHTATVLITECFTDESATEIHIVAEKRNLALQ